MKHYKVINNGYIVLIGTGANGEEITEVEYNTIKNIIDNRPIAPDGYSYKLTESLTWERYELPIETDEPIEGEDMTETEMKAAAYDILVGDAK